MGVHGTITSVSWKFMQSTVLQKRAHMPPARRPGARYGQGYGAFGRKKDANDAWKNAEAAIRAGRRGDPSRNTDRDPAAPSLSALVS